MSKFNKFIFLSTISVVAVLGFLNFAEVAQAMTPTLSVSATGSGDNVQINVIGDPSVSILLFIGSQSTVLGNTNSSGTFSNVVSSATVITNGIASNTVVYVRTNGLNGPQSNTVYWPYVNSSSTTSTLTLSQTALLLNVGQTSTITASANYLYVLSNSSPAVANINLNSNQITVTANTYGSTVANVCILGSTTNCSTITVTVQSSGASQLAFSQNNFSLVSGQTSSISVSGGTGYYTISNNSNPSSIQSALGGSVVTLTATSTTGAASITICTTDNNNCGIINVSATALNSTTVSFSQTNPVVAIGQSTTVTIFGGTGNNFYVSSNSNPSVVQANVNSNILTLIANTSTGTATISVCAYAGSCASLTANVSSSATTGTGALSLSQNSVSILAGQSSNITILGGSTPYSLSAPNAASIFNGVINGNSLTIYGVNAGNAPANVCSSVGCTTLSVTVNSSTSSVNPPTFSQNNVLITTGQQTTVYVSGAGSYYVANNTAPTVASVQISGSSLVVSALQGGSATISICQNGGQCASLYVTVSGTSSGVQLVLSQTSLSLTAGQSQTISMTGGGSYYVANNTNANVASVVINGSSAAITGINTGGTNISICQNGGQCANLAVAVGSSSTSAASLTVSSSTQSIAPGLLVSFIATPVGFTSPSYSLIDSFAGTTISNANINSSGYFTWTPSQVDLGTHSITIFATDSFAHSATTTTQIIVTQSTVQPSPAVASYSFTKYLKSGDSSADVLQLQKILAEKGFLKATPNGHYGAATVAAVKSFQKAHKLNQLGVVGPATRDILNQILASFSTTTTTGSTSGNAQQVSTIQAAIQQLLAQVAQMQGQ